MKIQRRVVNPSTDKSEIVIIFNSSEEVDVVLDNGDVFSLSNMGGDSLTLSVDGDLWIKSSSRSDMIYVYANIKRKLE